MMKEYSDIDSWSGKSCRAQPYVTKPCGVFGGDFGTPLKEDENTGDLASGNTLTTCPEVCN